MDTVTAHCFTNQYTEMMQLSFNDVWHEWGSAEKDITIVHFLCNAHLLRVAYTILVSLTKLSSCIDVTDSDSFHKLSS